MIRTETDADGIVTLTWDMPGRSQNVFDGPALQALADALQQARDTDGIKGIVITSAKRDFIAGADITMLQKMTANVGDLDATYEAVGHLGALLRGMETGGIPVVAAINGHALGGGLELCLACHHRVIADDPRLRVGFPEATIGLLPGAGGTQRAPRLVGIQASMPLLLEGKRIGAADAAQMGLVDEVVPPAELIDRAKAWILGGGVAEQPWDRKGFKIPGGGPELPEISNVFMVASALFQSKTHGNYPAGKAILSCLYEGCRLNIDGGLEVEKRYFVELLRGSVARSMIRTMFVSMQEASKLARRPQGPERKPPTKIGVLGSGLMGSGIAYSSAKAGLPVVVLDVSDEAAAKAIAYADRIESKAISRGRGTEAKKAELLGRIQTTTSFDDLADCDLVIEAVFEDRAIKADVTAKVDAVLADGAVLASNTSTLPITGLAEASSRPESFVGLHFFSPVEKMQLVEVIVGEQTSDTTLAHALDAVQAMGKTPIVVRDSRGFYTSRVFGTYVNEGMAMLLEGIAPALIENAGRMSGMPMPPLGLADEVGIGLMHQVGVQTRKDLGDAAPPTPSWPVLVAMVEELGRTGKRAGKGFYSYDDGKALWSGLAERFPIADTQPEAADIIQRFLYVQAVEEAARCMDEGILLAAADADVGAVLGWGYAPYTGGPLTFIENEGVAHFVATADALADAYGERFRPPALLRKMADDGRTSFYD